VNIDQLQSANNNELNNTVIKHEKWESVNSVHLSRLKSNPECSERVNSPTLVNFVRNMISSGDDRDCQEDSLSVAESCISATLQSCLVTHATASRSSTARTHDLTYRMCEVWHQI